MPHDSEDKGLRFHGVREEVNRVPKQSHAGLPHRLFAFQAGRFLNLGFAEHLINESHQDLPDEG
jgi:hypothetical protein